MIAPPPRTATPPATGLEPAERHPSAPAPGTVLPSHYRRCVACGPEHPTGLRLVTTAGEGLSVTSAVFVVVPMEHFTEHAGVVQTDHSHDDFEVNP